MMRIKNVEPKIKLLKKVFDFFQQNNFMKSNIFTGICSCFILFSVFVSYAAAATTTKILILDFSDSIIGEYLEKDINCNAPDVVVKRVTNVEELSQASYRDCNSVVFVRPVNPKYYPEILRIFLDSLLPNESVGLVLLGLPEAQADVESLFQFIGKRDVAKLDNRYPNSIDNGYWIWSQEYAKENQTVYFRKKIEIKEKHQKVFLWFTADNSGSICLNGSEVGKNSNWKKINILDVTDKIKIGENVIAAECWNESGPAGLLLGLLSIDGENGSWLTVSDKTWKYSLSKGDDWKSFPFNDSSWKVAKQIAAVGEGAWEQRMEADCAWRQRAFEIVKNNHPAIQGLSNPVGKVWNEWALNPINNGISIIKSGNVITGVSNDAGKGWKTFIWTINMERSPENERIKVMNSSAFAGMLLRSVLWSAGKTDFAHNDKWIIPMLSNKIENAKGDIRKDNKFPVVMQFSALPYHLNPLRKRNNKELNNSRDVVSIIDDIKRHGFSSLYFAADSPLPIDTINYARLQGLDITTNLGSTEMFHRDEPPKICVYSREYEPVVEKNYLERSKSLKSFQPISRMFAYNDEPFHRGVKSFGYNKEIVEEFKKRYGYELPTDMEAAGKDPRKWLDVINFRSDYFSDGWNKCYKILKKHDPETEIIMTHDSHNTLGAGIKQQAQITVDDVFHWGGAFADIFVFDIYPYMMVDFRYGKNREIPKPRMSQTHYSMAQIRNLARTYNKKAGFWFGTYNDTWFKLNEERKAQYWSENEMCYTAVASDSDLLIAGLNIPQDQKHWDTLGRGLNTIQKVGGRLLETRKVKAKAAFLFPRAQCIQLQEEYWNVAMSFEAFLRSFGELDVIHEEQIKDPLINGYDILVLYDVKMLPANVAENIAKFVQNGGVVIADSVPVMNEYKEPMKIMEGLFGVTNPETSRIMPEGAYVSLQSDIDELKTEKKTKSTEVKTAFINGKTLGESFSFTAISPRSSKCTDGEVLLQTETGAPALVKKNTGKGKTYLLGFCLQDTYFNTYAKNDDSSRNNIYGLLAAIAKDANVKAHVYSSNPDIEAAIRANKKEAFLFVISHEAVDNNTVISISEMPFTIKKIVNVETSEELPFEKDVNSIKLKVTVPSDLRTCLLVLQTE